MRIAVGGIHTECSTYSPVLTTIEDFRASYVLQYSAAGVAEDGWHELSLTVTKRSGLEIRARKGYMGRGRIASPGEKR